MQVRLFGNHDLAILIDAAVDQLLERVSVRNSLRGDDPDFRQMAAQGVERRRALSDHELARDGASAPLGSPESAPERSAGPDARPPRRSPPRRLRRSCGAGHKASHAPAG